MAESVKVVKTSKVVHVQICTTRAAGVLGMLVHTPLETPVGILALEAVVVVVVRHLIVTLGVYNPTKLEGRLVVERVLVLTDRVFRRFTVRLVVFSEAVRRDVPIVG